MNVDPEVTRQLQQMNDKLGSVSAAMETSFGVIRRDIHWIGKAHVPALVASFIALILSISSLVIALDTRNQVLSVSAQTTKNTRDLENIFPLIFPLPNITAPKE